MNVSLYPKDYLKTYISAQMLPPQRSLPYTKSKAVVLSWGRFCHPGDNGNGWGCVLLS